MAKLAFRAEPGFHAEQYKIINSVTQRRTGPAPASNRRAVTKF